MEQTHAIPAPPCAAPYCQCGAAIRFVSSEPHPVQIGVDLHNFGCTRCDFVQVLTVPSADQPAA